ncbi:MAG: fimbria/pilus outer membrane usher protein [Gammaproteobacteria bacterium]|nr:fimbria/pilus outer membrane usher protein [Gammaproteobacteria bacterium]
MPSHRPGRGATGAVLGLTLATTLILDSQTAALGQARGTVDSSAASASESTAAGTSLRDQLLLLDVTMNGLGRGVTLFMRDTDGRYFVSADTLATWGVERPYPSPVIFQNRRFHPLVALAGVRMRHEAQSMTADIDIPAELLGDAFVSFSPRNLVAPTTATGAFLDYDLAYTSDSAARENSLSSLLAPTVFTRHGNLSSELLYRGDSYTLGALHDDWVRLDTTWTIDDPDQLRSIRVGDAVTLPGSWGRSVRFAGVQLASNYATQPTMITFPQPSISGTAAVPSALDIFVNGSLRSRVDVPDGAFQIDAVPVVTGAGEIQVVARDLLGREQIITQSFYASEQLLRAGLSDYSVSAGRLRNNYALESNDYGDFLVEGALRRGLSSRLTMAARFSGTANTQLAGTSILFSRQELGLSSISAAASTGDSRGTLWQVGHQYQGRKYRADLRVQGTSSGFAQPGLEIPAAFPKRQVVTSAGMSLGTRGSLGASFLTERFHETQADRRILTLSYSRSLPRGLSFSTSASQIRGEISDVQASLVVSRALGPRSATSASLFSRSDETTLRVDHRYQLPLGPGYGYRTSVFSGDEKALDAEVSVNTAYAKYSAEVRRHDAGHGWRLQTRGSIALLDGAVFAAREISDGFAVVNAGGFEDVRVYLENQEIGVTDDRGRLLVPRLRPYETNRLRLETADLPLTARIGNPSLAVSPYYRSGTIADFGIHVDTNVLLRVLDENGAPITEGARARSASRSSTSPVGLDGRLYLENVEPGILVEIVQADYVCSLELPEFDEHQLLPDLGDVYCRRSNAESEHSTTRSQP